jgi:hypothetical protein
MMKQRRVASGSQSARRRLSWLVSLACASFPVLAVAKNCNTSGNLAYLGVLAGQTKSVWLSATSPGAFDLVSAQGNTTVDSWSRARRGLHVSLSPNVSNGNGGTHKLYDSSGCLLDTQNQKGGITFPPNINFPPTLPPSWRPPTGITPGLPIGVMPPIGTLPPLTGITPEVPVAVRPPIGTLPPPTGITPEVPVAVRPPIGTLPPPTGITPEVPVAVRPPIGTLPPPTGVTPEVPVAVRPPIGTLPPPTGITPEVPVAVRPPIGTLPPPTGVTPEVPVAVRPPIGTLPPPTGITPEVPVAVRPPIGTLPPPTGVTPEVPVAVIPPIGTLPPPTGVSPELPETAKSRTAALPATVEIAPQLRCADGLHDPAAVIPPNVQWVDCSDPRQKAQVSEQQSFGTAAPITPGREFAEPTEWNVWSDARYSHISDHRWDFDSSGHSGSLTLGADRQLNDDLVVGFSVSVEDNRFLGFGDSWRVESSGYTIGPYLGYRLSSAWTLDASLAAGRLDSDSRIDSLVGTISGDYTTNRYLATLSARGQYVVDDTNLRPSFTVSYAHYENKSYSMGGSLFGIPLRVAIDGTNYNSGLSEAALEVNRVVKMGNDKTVVPYAEVSASYLFDLPERAQNQSLWNGSLRVGARALVGNLTFVEAGVGYLSIGQKGLDIWEGRLFVSHAF